MCHGEKVKIIMRSVVAKLSGKMLHILYESLVCESSAMKAVMIFLVLQVSSYSREHLMDASIVESIIYFVLRTIWYYIIEFSFCSTFNTLYWLQYTS